MNPRIITAPSVSNALAQGLTLLNSRVTPGAVIRENSRNGGVSVWDGPVLTQSLNPMNRVLFSPMRNANPFFHLFEALWMLGGRNDLPWVAQFNKQMASYSDDGGKTQPAAYGHRWRGHFGHDQLNTIVDELKHNSGTRRAVLGMWDPWFVHTYDHGEGPIHHFGDLEKAIGGSSDVPCNTQCFFTVRDGALHMAVTCRSNDILWGAHGANAVHFSILLEYVAARCGLAVGEMTQFSWNYHLYDGILKQPLEAVIFDLLDSDRYTGRVNPVQATPIFSAETMDEFERCLPIFLNWLDPAVSAVRPALGHYFLDATALTMHDAWTAWKHGEPMRAVELCAEIAGTDWRIACTEWIQRKLEAK